MTKFLPNHITILVIGCYPASLAMLVQSLREAGYQVQLVGNRPQLVEQVKIALPDLILLDFTDTKLNSQEICRQLQEEPLTQAIPIIALIESGGERTLGPDLLKIGVVDYVLQPCYPGKLLLRVRLHLQLRYQSQSQLREKIQQAETILERLTAATAGVTGEDFFVALVENLASALGTRQAMVTQRIGHRLHTLAFWSESRLSPNLEFPLEGTCCQQTLKLGSYHCPTSVQQQFPEISALTQMQADSYLGVVMTNLEGQSLGTLCVFDHQPLWEVSHSRSILRIFADRAAAELERLQESVIQQRQTQQAFQQQLAAVQAAVEAAIEGIAIFDAQDLYIYVNRAYIELFGYDNPAELLGKNWRYIYNLEEVEHFDREVMPILRRDRYWQGEANGRRRDGSSFAEDFSLTLIDDGGMVCVCRNITERKQAEAKLNASLQEKELLLKEIHHRVKNNLLVVSSLLEWQSSCLKDPAIRKILDESQQRIYSIALIHEKLYKSKNLFKIDFGDYLENLVRQLIFSLTSDIHRIKLHLELEQIFLNAETATPCGLIVSELITNAFKHAFPEEQPGRLCLKLHQNSQEEIKLSVQDNGVGLPPGLDCRKTESLGLQLVFLLAKQLNAQIEVLQEGGTTFNLSFSELCYCKRI